MALIVDIKVVPSSGRRKFFVDKSGILKCYLKSAPEGGKANQELVKFLARNLKLTQNDIKIILGATARRKRVKINMAISLDELITILKSE